MARGVGLDAGVFEVKVVELEGSYRKPRLAKVSIDRVAAPGPMEGDDARARVEAEAALQALKGQNVTRHGVNLGFPSREAVVRNLRIPFVGDDAIRKVIKFEAESSIHSHNVDDMVVDFQTYERGEGESSVIVAAVPKKTLGSLLEALEDQGIEPERVDLDAMALFRAAEWAGCFGEGAAEAAAAAAETDGEEALPAVATSALDIAGRRARIVIDVGGGATRVLAAVEDLLIDLRSLRIGFDAVAEDIARSFGLSLDEARDAVVVGLQTGQDVVLDAADEPADESGEEPDEEEGETTTAVAVRSERIGHDAIVAACDRFLARLHRELLRFLTALPRIAEVERLFMTGSACALPVVSARLADVFGCQPQQLDVLSHLSHDLDAEEAEQIGPRIVTAVGLALAMMGGKGGFDFRREELSYRRHFDRIKFPLAIACMLGIFLPFIYGVRQYKKLEDLGKRYGEVYEVTEGGGNRRGATGIRAVFWGYVGQLMNAGQSNNVIRHLGATDFAALVGELVDRPTYERLPVIRSRLQRHLQQQQEQTGVYESLQLSSGVYVLSYFSKLVKGLEDQLGSFLISELEVKLPSQANNRYLAFKIAIRGPEFRSRFAMLEDAFRASFNDVASPFSAFGRSSGASDVFEDQSLEGAYFQLRLDIKEDFAVRAAR